MTSIHNRLFHNHPIEVKKQFERLSKLQQLRKISQFNQLEIFVFKPYTVKFHRIHWDTLKEEDDTILVTLEGGKTVSVSYATMTIID